MNTTVAASVKAMLAASAKPKAPAKSDKLPVVSVPELLAQARTLADCISKKKDLEAQIAILEADLKPAAEMARVELSRQGGAFVSSINFNGLTYQTQCRYSDIKPELAAKARELLPEHELYFHDEYAVGIATEKLTPELLAALQAAGAEITVTTKATKAYHEDRTLKADVAAVAASIPEIKPVAFFRA